MKNAAPTLTGPMEILIGEISPSPTNPRKHFAEGPLKELADNIGRYGIIQPILVRPNPPRFEAKEPDMIDKTWRLWDLVEKKNIPMKSESEAKGEALKRNGARFELVAGERRFRAAGLAKLKSVPAIVRPLTDTEVLEIQYIENLQRQDLTAIEEAEGFAALIKTGNYTPDTLAEKLGKSRSHIFGRLRLVRLIGPVRKALNEDKLHPTVAGLLAQIPDPDKQVEAMKQVVDNWGRGPMSFREAKEHIARQYMVSLAKAAFNTKDATLEGGPCALCLKRSGNMTAEFPDIGHANVCTDTFCFERKQAAAWKSTTVEAVKNGQRIMDAKEWDKVRYSGRYQQLDEVCYQDSKRRSYKTLIGKERLPILAQERDGTVVEVLTTIELAPLLKKAGIKDRRNDSGTDQKEAREAARLEAAIAEQVTEQVLERIKVPNLGNLRILASAAMRSCWSDSARPIWKRRGMPDQESVAKAALEMSELDAFRLLVEVLILRSLRGQWTVKDHLEKFLKLYGVDRDAIEKRVKEELKSKKTGGVKPK